MPICIMTSAISPRDTIPAPMAVATEDDNPDSFAPKKEPISLVKIAKMLKIIIAIILSDVLGKASVRPIDPKKIG